MRTSRHNDESSWRRWVPNPRDASSGAELFVHAPDSVRQATATLPPRRVAILRFLGVAVVAIIAFRSALLQLGSVAVLRSRAEGNRVRVLVEYAPRGVIFDRRGTPLVENTPSTDLVAYPVQLPMDIETIISVLRDIFPHVSASEFRDRLQNLDRGSAKPVPLLANIPHSELLTVLARGEQLPGVTAESRAVRQYAQAPAFAHVLGYTGRISKEELAARTGYLPTEYVGKSGLERTYERVLRGTHGARQVEVNAAGDVQGDLGTIAARPGGNLRLTLDAELQQVLFDTLTARIRDAGATQGAAVALDPRSGAVRALVSVPSFDANAFSRGLKPEDAKAIFSDPLQPFLDRTIQGQYPPGSTFKLVVAAAALEEGILRKDTTIESTGGIRVGQWFFPDWKPGGHGRTDLLKALAESVNTFFYTIGGGVEGREGLGVSRMTAYAERFGLGNATTIDLPEEASGFLPSEAWKKRTKDEPWYIGDTYHLAIGQGDLLVTPLQLALVTSTIANGGTLYTPALVEAFVREDGTVIEYRKPVVRAARVVSAATAAAVREGMRASVTNGSSRGLQDAPVAVAGKTGTAQVGNKDTTHAWFTAFAPYENPELVLTVLVEKGGGGDRVAVPIARDVFRWYFGSKDKGGSGNSSVKP